MVLRTYLIASAGPVGGTRQDQQAWSNEREAADEPPALGKDAQ